MIYKVINIPCFNLILRPISCQVCLLYTFLRSIHLKILILSVFTGLCASLSPGYLEEPFSFDTYIGSKAFSGVSPPIPGVLYSFTSLFRRTPYFPGVSLNLLVFLVFTRFYWSSPLFAGVPYLNHQIFFKLHQLFLKLPITFIAMLDASMVAPYFQCYD